MSPISVQDCVCMLGYELKWYGMIGLVCAKFRNLAAQGLRLRFLGLHGHVGLMCGKCGTLETLHV